MGQKKDKQKKRNAKKDNDYHNPDIREQLKHLLTPEQIENYKKMGEEMYNTVDFTTNEIIGSNDPLVETVAYISEAIKSGLHPSYITADESKIMEEWGGRQWYKKFGYDKLDF